MLFNWSAFTRRFLLLGVLILGIVAFVMNSFFQSQLAEAKKNELGQYEKYLHETISTLVHQKQAETQILAVALSNSIDFRQILKKRPDDLHERLKKFTDELALYIHYKSIWIQVINAKGITIGRSWTKAQGDNLALIRKDIKAVLKNPRKINDFSVGKFSLTFKSLAPIFDKNGRLLGILDVISQVDSIDRDLKVGTGADSVVLVDKHYRKQLTNARTGHFMDGYYVANLGVSEAHLKLISDYGVEKLFSAKGPVVIGDQLAIATPLKNILGQKIAVWLSFKPLKFIDVSNVHQFYKNYALAIGAVTLFLLLSMLLFYFKKKSDLERQFFYQVFDESSEVIYVTDRTQVLQANRQFFNLFECTNGAEEFNARYDCVSNLLIEEEGYLTRYIDGLIWYEYLLKHSQQSQLAKIETSQG